MILSIGMMVKNEEKNLERCLNSLMTILNCLDSELIIIDTGSTDRTVEIAKKYTDKIYFQEWNNNFSEMRNIVLSYCKGDWFLCIDADEMIENCDDIIKFFKTKECEKYNTAEVYVNNLINSNDKTNFSSLTSPRLFKKDGSFKYVNAVHNQPLYKKPIKELSTVFVHYGYIKSDKELMERKYTRTVTILKNELKKDPENIYYLYQLSSSYSMHDEHYEAIKNIQKAYDMQKNIYIFFHNYVSVIIMLKIIFM